jgi:hypothetical protein
VPSFDEILRVVGDFGQEFNTVTCRGGEGDHGRR